MPPHDPTLSAPVTHTAIVVDLHAKTKPPKKVSYAFVDLVRFLATIGIVYIHTNVPMHGMQTHDFLQHVNHAEYYYYVKQLFKFSTICYFLIAGFLLADKTIEGSPFTYYFRRLNVIAVPYVLALIVFVAALTFQGYLKGNHVNARYVIEVVKFVMLYSPFWYIPNYLLCLLVIVLFSKYTSSLWFGGILLLLTAWNTWYNVYAGNTHTHTTALTGFIFYMWLGMYIKQKNLIAGIQKINPLITGVILLACYVLSDLETRYTFYHTHITETINTLRITNQFYSVAFFVFIVSCCKGKVSFGPLNPRKETYGIYLYHSLFTFILVDALEKWMGDKMGINLFSYNVYEILLLGLVNFVISYIAATLLVKILLKFKLAWLPQM